MALNIPDQNERAAKYLDECEDPRLCREIAQRQLCDEFINATLEGVRLGLAEGERQRLEMALQLHEQNAVKEHQEDSCPHGPEHRTVLCRICDVAKPIAEAVSKDLHSLSNYVQLIEEIYRHGNGCSCANPSVCLREIQSEAREFQDEASLSDPSCPICGPCCTTACGGGTSSPYVVRDAICGNCGSGFTVPVRKP